MCSVIEKKWVLHKLIYATKELKNKFFRGFIENEGRNCTTSYSEEGVTE